MRIALVADIHGNPVALDAVLADARAQGVDQIWFLGDYCAIGPEPAAVLDRINALPDTRFIRGNTDRYVITGEGPPPHLHDVRQDPDLIPTFARIAASFAWTAGALAATGWIDWLEALPLDFRDTLDTRARVLAVHAAPGQDDGEGVHPGRSNAELGALLDDCAADLVVVAHTHEPMARRVGAVLVVNPGSVGNPRAPDLRASYALIETDGAGIVDVRHRRVAYDMASFIDAVERSRHPAAGYILSHYRGGQPARPPHADHVPLEPGRPVRL